MVHEAFIKSCQQAGRYTTGSAKLPSIYRDAMRLVRDGFIHSEIVSLRNGGDVSMLSERDPE